MIMSVYPSQPSGEISAIASKSVAHRLLICAAFADGSTLIRCEETNKDIEATVACLSALGADIKRNAPFYYVSPITDKSLNTHPLLPCGESGSTLRFLLPIAAALGIDAEFLMEGRLPQRPLSPLREELEAHGISLSPIGSNPLTVSGKLSGGFFSISGNVSSQFISGLLFALTLMGEGASLSVLDKIESAPYIDITCDALALFGAKVQIENNIFTVSKCKLTSPKLINVEGDWSNAAFPLALGIIGKGKVTVDGLSAVSSQGDAKITELFTAFGGRLDISNGKYTAMGSALHSIDIDASQIPDLVPILATVASVATGTTKICGASRLRLKESDRIESVCNMLLSLGADITATEDGMIIKGKPVLTGGRVSSYGDHRIAMSAAVAASVCSSPVIIEGAEAVEKSYPLFFRHLNALGIKTEKQ